MRTVRVFKDKSGNKVQADFGKPNPENTVSILKLQEGWSVEDISKYEYFKKYPAPINQTIQIPKPLNEKVGDLEIVNKVLVELIEEELKLPKGKLQQRIKEKLDGKV